MELEVHGDCPSSHAAQSRRRDDAHDDVQRERALPVAGACLCERSAAAFVGWRRLAPRVVKPSSTATKFAHVHKPAVGSFLPGRSNAWPIFRLFALDRQ